MKRTILIIICLIISAISLYFYFQPDIEIKQAQNKYEEIIKETVEKDDNQFLSIDFDALHAQNSDIIGWIDIPNTEHFSYPVMQSHDNHEYLITSFDGQKSELGVPFLDINCSTDFSDFNSVIYGHYTINHYMFGELYDLMKDDTYQLFDTIYLYTIDGRILVYKIFSAKEVVIADTQMFTFGSYMTEQKQSFIQEALSTSKYDFNINVNPENNVLNLVCCTQMVEKERRLVISATLVETLTSR